MNIDLFISIILIVTTLLIVGYGVTGYIIPKYIGSYRKWFIPWVGLMCIILAVISLNFLGLTISFVKFPLIIILSIITVIVFIKKNNRIDLLMTMSDVIIIMIMILSLIITLLPMAWTSNMTSLTLGNNDSVIYSSAAKFLEDNTILGDRIGNPQIPITITKESVLSINSERWGSVVLLSFFSNLLGFQPEELIYVLMSLLFALTVPLIYTITKFLFSNIKDSTSLLITLIVSLNINIYYIFFNNFFGQIVWYGLFYIFIILVEAKSNELNKKLDIRYIISLAIVVNANLVIYLEALPFIIIPYAIYVFYLAFYRKKFNLLKESLLAAVLTVALNPLAIKALFLTLVMQSNGTNGWDMPRYAEPLDWVGLNNILYKYQLPRFVSLIFNCFVVMLVIKSINQIKSKAWTIIIILIYSLFLLFFYDLRHYSYGYFKAMTYVVPLVVILFCYGISDLIIRIPKPAKVLAITIVVLIELTNLAMLEKEMINKIRIDKWYVQSKYQSLTEVNENSNVNKPIYINNESYKNTDYWETLWKAYYLDEKPIILSKQNGYLSSATIMEMPSTNDLILNDKSSSKLAFGVINRDIIWENDYYTLSDFKIAYKFSNSWYPIEGLGTNNNWRWMNLFGEILIVSDEDQIVNMSFNMASYNKNTVITLYSNEEQVNSFDINTNSQIYDTKLSLNKGLNKIVFNSNGKNEKPMNDPRELSVVIQDINFY